MLTQRNLLHCSALTATAVAVAALTAGGMTLTSPGAGANPPVIPPYSIGTSVIGPGSGVVVANGNLVLAWNKTVHKNEEGYVCVLPLGAKSCSSHVGLKPLGSDSVFGTAEVFATGGNDVSVIVQTCCSQTNGDLRFNSTDGGKTFGAPTGVGTADVHAATLAGGELVWAGSNHVQQVSPTSSVPAAGSAQLGRAADAESMTTYKGGVVYAEHDVDTNAVEVFYAPKGSDFGTTASYQRVAKLKGVQLGGVSGAALLTVGGSLGTKPKLSMFNGTSYGSAEDVPVMAKSDNGQFLVYQSSSGKVHVSYNNLRDHDSNITEWTKDGGKTWPGFTNQGSLAAAQAEQFVLNNKGNGVMLAIGPKAWVQPIGTW